jgi:hypothetical protein
MEHAERGFAKLMELLDSTLRSPQREKAARPTCV